MGGRQIALGVLVAVLAPAVAVCGGPGRSWQDGELLSRKTVPMGRTFLRNRFVYRVRGLNREYLVESQTPLRLDLYVPMKFSPDRRKIVIRDADGRECKVHILQRAAVSLRR
jgi:hypothetical protein